MKWEAKNVVTAFSHFSVSIVKPIFHSAFVKTINNIQMEKEKNIVRHFKLKEKK